MATQTKELALIEIAERMLSLEEKLTEAHKKSYDKIWQRTKAINTALDEYNSLLTKKHLVESGELVLEGLENLEEEPEQEETPEVMENFIAYDINPEKFAEIYGFGANPHRMAITATDMGDYVFLEAYGYDTGDVIWSKVVDHKTLEQLMGDE